MTQLNDFSVPEPDTNGLQNIQDNDYFSGIPSPTAEEWWAEHAEFYSGYVGMMIFNNGEPVESKIASQQPSQQLFRYVGHRTTSQKSVVLEFESLDGKLTAVKFFNVKLSSGNKSYPAGYKGQFNSQERSNFRKFWMQAVGKKPDRWCRVHKSMKSCLRNITFKGNIIDAHDKKGNHYLKFTEVAAIKK